MRKNVLLLLLGLFIWIFGGLWLYHQCCCCADGGVVTTTATSKDQLTIKDGTYFSATASNNVVFDEEQATYTMSKEVEEVFAQTTMYLNQHPAKVLKIETPSSDLEQKRGVALTTYLSGIHKANLNQIKTKHETIDQRNYTFLCLQPFTTTNGSGAINCSDNFVFERSGFESAVPVSKELEEMLENVAKYLKENPTEKLDIIGHYLASEENNSSATNLGKARASTIRSILLDKYGVPPNQVGYSGLQKEKLLSLSHQSFKEELVIGPIDFVFSKQENTTNADDKAAKIKALEKDLLVTPRRLYFDTGKNRIIIDDEFRTYFEKVIYYLENVPTASIECSGHTDNRGQESSNLKLAQERADFAANYFSKQGISSKKITTVSLGEKQPIESNKTANGRAKNRRVEIIVKQQ